MNDRAFRLDFFIAIAALLVSALTAGTLIYQTRVISRQYAAAIWPYLSVTTTNDLHGVTIELSNDGLGPALIRSAQLNVDGEDVPSWNAAFPILTSRKHPEIRALFLRALALRARGQAPGLAVTTSSIGPSTTLRPGEKRTLISVVSSEMFPIAGMAGERIAMSFCYCSLNDSCWKYVATPTGRGAGSDPKPVARCSGDSAIDSFPPAPAKASRR